MADLLALSRHIIDAGVVDSGTGPTNRISNELSEIADGLAVVESFSHCVAWKTSEGLACFDASGVFTGPLVVEALNKWTSTPVSHLIYTHGHADHIGGSPAFAAAAAAKGVANPRVIGHENIAPRVQRYRDTNGWNRFINAKQFGGIRVEHQYSLGGDKNHYIPPDVLEVTESFREQRILTIGDHSVELNHAIGETDDHLWAWVPDKKWIMAGDFLIWNFPNAGNPQKVQRYPLEWAKALRDMAAKQPELLLPAHGLPIDGKERIEIVLTDIASALETLVSEVLVMMNDGATLDSIIHSVSVPQDVLNKPYLRPMYDEPEFVVHNIWRLYGGWWDGAPSRLKPSPDAQLGAVIAELSGGVNTLVARALHELAQGDFRMACHLIDFAAWAEPENSQVHEARSDIYEQRRSNELSLMSKGIFKAAARESRAAIRHSQEPKP